jgi:hypothetical protein
MASQKITHDELNLLIKLAKKVLWCDRETKRKIKIFFKSLTDLN